MKISQIDVIGLGGGEVMKALEINMWSFRFEGFRLQPYERIKGGEFPFIIQPSLTLPPHGIGTSTERGKNQQYCHDLSLD